MNSEFIYLKGVRTNNLKNIDVKIPKGKITVFTGVSGSGKSSIVFDTISQEAGRLLNETYPSFTRLFLPRYSRPDADEIINLSPAIVVDQKRIGGNARSTVGTITDINSLLRLLYSRFATPHLGYGNAYSFNDPAGMCPKCEGIGKIVELNLDAVLDKEKSINEGAVLLSFFDVGSFYWKTITESGLFDNDKKLKDFSDKEMDLLLDSEPTKIFVNEMGTTFEGLRVRFMRTNVKTDRESNKQSDTRLDKFTHSCTCPLCHGKRYNDKVLGSLINNYSIYDLTAMQIDQAYNVLVKIKIPEMAPILADITRRLKALCDIGLFYLTLSRQTSTLSGGESQRIKMVKHLSGSLNGMMYIFDEPSIGLHPRDVHCLNETLIGLRDKGNTVLVVEHDPDVIKIADHIIDVGPNAGTDGGQIMYEGDFAGLVKSNTLTGKFISKSIGMKAQPRASQEFYKSKSSTENNLKNISLNVPVGLFTVVSGVAGSGKSTLVREFVKEYKDAIWIDQAAVRTSSRSSPATFTGVLNAIRKGFASENSVDAGLFSSNSLGKCEICGGRGVIELNMSFMDKMEVECSGCNGTRFKPEVLQYLYKNKNIVQVMKMTIDDAVDFFTQTEIIKKLKQLQTVGLGYLTLGQPLDTLSGGESQRLKLACELGAKGKIYILDEPTTGLHMSDTANIIKIIDKLVQKGNTVIVIEHNLDVLRQSDWLIDIGPDGGSAGGEILYEGPPSSIINCEKSYTAKYIIAF